MILCLGATPVYQRTMVFDRVTIDAVNRATRVTDYASGKSINVARVVHSLGQDATATGFAGGRGGEMLRQDLDAAGIRHDFVIVGVQTRQCITVIDRAAGTATELVEESLAVEPSAWEELSGKLRQLLPRARVWVFSGTLPPGAPADFYARWLPLARELDAKAIIDARGEPLQLAMRHPNGILKINRQELAATLEADLRDESKLTEAMLRHTPPKGWLIVTLGAAGAIASDGKSCWHVSSPKVCAASAIGSGDAFAAGLAVALDRLQDLREGLKLAAACGAANAITELAGHVDTRQVQRFLSEIEMT